MSIAINPVKNKRPPCGGLKNTNDEKNLFRKIQTEYHVNCCYTIPAYSTAINYCISIKKSSFEDW